MLYNVVSDLSYELDPWFHWQFDTFCVHYTQKWNYQANIGTQWNRASSILQCISLDFFYICEHFLCVGCI